ncbi:MAG TPA: helix-turn-helix transcriptional regulator [Xanthomonadaceae bacterium]
MDNRFSSHDTPTAPTAMLTSLPSGGSPVIKAPLDAMRKGWIQLDGDILRRLRLSRYMSQQDLANDCWHRDIRVSIATIKRAECGHPVRFRIARELARCFGVPVEQLLRLSA